MSRRSVCIDLIIHVTCKLLGHLGTNPKYCRGAVETQQLDNMTAAIYVRLERQVGSQYFVTSRTAGRIFFLAPHAVNYIRSLEKTKELNNLKRDVLKNDFDKALLKVSFDAIYADLMCLLQINRP